MRRAIAAAVEACVGMVAYASFVNTDTSTLLLGEEHRGGRRARRPLAGAGLPAAFADLLADTSLAASRGDWYTDSTDLPELIGRPSTPLATAVVDALRAGPAGTFDPRG